MIKLHLKRSKRAKIRFVCTQIKELESGKHLNTYLSGNEPISNYKAGTVDTYGLFLQKKMIVIVEI